MLNTQNFLQRNYTRTFVIISIIILILLQIQYGFGASIPSNL